MPTPPPSDMTQEASRKSRRRSPKRPRQDNTPEENISQDTPFYDNQTPTGPTRNASDGDAESPFFKSTSKKTYRRHLTGSSISHMATNSYLTQLRKRTRASGQRAMSGWFLEHLDDKTAYYMEELAALLKINDAARYPEKGGARESAWNLDIHGPLLELALKQLKSLKRELLTHARISPPFIPELRTDSFYDIISYNLIAVPIETKNTTGHMEEAGVQLGLWVAAWHKQMNALRTNNEHVITLLLIIAVEHEWTLLFAYDGENTAVKGINMGGTMDLVGLYRVPWILRELAIRIETEHVVWWDR
ncbi:hypothetical protein IWW34DRAFT_812463 [Fusarium oxysporum f. sp. albedinis]|nr:hypothetical protein IWW34DRAFT_812463 [Fusarium oxysporum f. sp. albedinis]